MNRLFEVRMEGYFQDGTDSVHDILAETHSKARYKCWLQFSDFLQSYSKCFKFMHVKVVKERRTEKIDHEQILIDLLNCKFKVGDKMKVKQDDGSVCEWTVRHEATILGGHSPVIWTVEHTPAYLASRVILE